MLKTYELGVLKTIQTPQILIYRKNSRIRQGYSFFSDQFGEIRCIEEYLEENGKEKMISRNRFGILLTLNSEKTFPSRVKEFFDQIKKHKEKLDDIFWKRWKEVGDRLDEIDRNEIERG